MEGPRAPQCHELEDVVGVIDAVFRPGRPSMGAEFPQLLSTSNVRRLRIFADSITGRPVAHAGYLPQELIIEGHRIPVAALGSVCTLPEYRGQGLASRLVESIMEQAASEGLAIMLISGDSGVYKRLGAVETGDFLTVQADGKGISRLCASGGERADELDQCGIALGRATPDDLPAMAAAYRRESVRYARSVSDFRELSWWNQGMDRLGGREHVWIARSEPGALAYIVTRLQTLEEGRLRLLVPEFAGARWAVMRLIAYACRELMPDILCMIACGSDREMIVILDREGLPTAKSNLFGYTVMALNSKLLREVVEPILAEKHGEGDMASLAARSGPRSGPELVERLFSGGGAIPLPVPGLNYV